VIKGNDPMESDVDVLVVGGGPAGLAVAERSVRAGRTLVVHQDAEIGHPVRTSGGSWKAHLVALGIPSRFYHEIDRLMIAAPGRRMEVSFGEDRPVVLDVTPTYQYLANLARATGAGVECATKFLGAVDQGTSLRCTVRQGDSEHHFSARYVVDASGHHRAVLRQIGGGHRPVRFGVGVEAEFENAGTEPTRAVLFVGAEFCPAGYGWIFPTRSGSVRVGIGIIRPDTNLSAGHLLNAFLSSSYADGLGLRVGALIEKHFGVIPSDGSASGFLHGRIISVGDAAGQALPLVGEGIRYSVEAGRKAGDAIAAALRDPNGAEAALQSYQSWWDDKYRVRFNLAQRANEKMGRFSDRRWHQATELLKGLSGDEMAALLRMEFGRWLALKLVMRGGHRAARFFLRRARR
jgi:digeranylgeranylglycerophospholipid reductase